MYRIAIFGYGNLGKGAESAVTAAADLELVGIFTRRDPETIHPASGAPVYSADHILTWKDSVDALIVCGSSAADLPEMTP